VPYQLFSVFSCLLVAGFCILEIRSGRSLASVRTWMTGVVIGFFCAGLLVGIRRFFSERHVRAGPSGLIVSNGFKTTEIPWARVMEVRWRKSNGRAIVRFDVDSPFGREIRFIPRMRVSLWRKPEEDPVLTLFKTRAGLLKHGRNDYEPAEE
jgi:hypothetical protein